MLNNKDSYSIISVHTTVDMHIQFNVLDFVETPESVPIKRCTNVLNNTCNVMFPDCVLSARLCSDPSLLVLSSPDGSSAIVSMDCGNSTYKGIIM